jgi:ribosomal-protein-alanine N-acetyltransferase
MPGIRRGDKEDLPAIAAIQDASPEAAHWDPADYLAQDLTVFESEGAVTGFLAARTVGAEEHEILNVAVAPANRRCGIARHLLVEWLASHPGSVYLEVRESNKAARNLYKLLGFQEVSVRPQYYNSPLETAIVLRFHSC